MDWNDWIVPLMGPTGILLLLIIGHVCDKRDKVYQAELKIHRIATEAERQMYKAAGQSWRRL